MCDVKEYFVLRRGRKFLYLQFDEDCRYLAKNNYIFKCDKTRLFIHIYLDNLDIYVVRYIDTSNDSKVKGKRFIEENTIPSIEYLFKGEIK